MHPLLPLLLLIPTLAFAQTKKPFRYPKFPPGAETVRAFIPKGWRAIDTAQGDLDGDKRPDIALVLEYEDSVQLTKRETIGDESWTDTVVTQPRVLVVLFRNPVEHPFRLAEWSTFIPNHDQENMEDPYRDITIKKEVLTVHTGIFMNMGGWDMSVSEYHWRYQQEAFRLIGIDSHGTNRRDGAEDDFSFNFLTRKYSHTHRDGYESEEDTVTKPAVVTWHPTPPGPLKTFRTFKRPYTWYRKEWDMSL